MKALIFNSGLGSRLKELTRDNPKCMIKLYNGETIFERQIRILSECGIGDFIITTGPFEDQLKECAAKFDNLHFTFVPNPEYETTNYIVSMDNAYDYLDGDTLMLHGDLVFNRELIVKVLQSKEESLCLYNETCSLPPKDFKGRFAGNKLIEVSVQIFDEDCMAFQPLYKLSKKDLFLWKSRVRHMVKAGIRDVYAENALNEISGETGIVGMSYKDDYIDEIDNAEDYARVSDAIRFFDYREQPAETADYRMALPRYIGRGKSVFVVCGLHMRMRLEEELQSLLQKVVIFSDFTPNPKFEEILNGVELFKRSACDVILSVGGGSSIDVAKCIKLFAAAKNVKEYPNCQYNYSNIKHIAVPTTAGTGSEATTFAVFYKDGIKESASHGMILPDAVVLDSSFLKDLPDYHKKSAMLDALAQAVESYTSRKAAKESMEYAVRAMNMILANREGYLRGDKECEEAMLLASDISGRAINLTKTTAPHAMSYKLTSLYGISHGHAVALCLIPCLKKLKEYAEDDDKISARLKGLAEALGCGSFDEFIEEISAVIQEAELPPVGILSGDITELASFVNAERLGNNLVVFGHDELIQIYEDIRRLG